MMDFHNIELAVCSLQESSDYYTQDEVGIIIDKVGEQVSSFVPNVSTLKGRNEVKAFITKINKVKKILEVVGIESVKKKKDEVKAVDRVRLDMVVSMNVHRDAARLALTEWENREKEAEENLRIQKEEEARIIREKEQAELEELRAQKAESDRILAENEALKVKVANQERAEKLRAEAEAQAEADRILAAIKADDDARTLKARNEEIRISQEKAVKEAAVEELRRIEQAKRLQEEIDAKRLLDDEAEAYGYADWMERERVRQEQEMAARTKAAKESYDTKHAAITGYLEDLGVSDDVSDNVAYNILDGHMPYVDVVS